MPTIMDTTNGPGCQEAHAIPGFHCFLASALASSIWLYEIVSCPLTLVIFIYAGSQAAWLRTNPCWQIKGVDLTFGPSTSTCV